jgi:hypothetical protein
MVRVTYGFGEDKSLHATQPIAAGSISEKEYDEDYDYEDSQSRKPGTRRATPSVTCFFA